MLQISAELLAMSGDAAVLIKNHKIVFANAEAYALLGAECLGKSVKAAFGEEIAGIQAGSYIGEFPVNSKRFILRASASDGIQAIFMAELDDKASLISDAFIFSLRNCLMSIDVTLSLLRSRIADHPEIMDSLQIISHESLRLNRILSNISIIRAIRSSQSPFAPIELDISSFIKNLLDSVSICVACNIQFKAPKELKVHADPLLIENLILNLLSNCIIHGKGSTQIKVSLVQGRDSCFICVDDNGCGIEAEKLHGVFNRYMHRYEMNDMSKGPGLGLTTARAIAGMHGGTLLLESRPGNGTSVRVSLSHKPYSQLLLSPQDSTYEPSMKNLLIGLAECLPSDYFSEKFFD